MRAHNLAGAAEFGDVDEVADVLVALEDFLLHAGAFIVDELAAYRLVRPDDPQSWVLWIADLLGEHAATLRALTPTTEATTLPAHQPIGEPR
jgi:hypothetical protein